MKRFIVKSAAVLALTSMPMMAAHAGGGNNHAALFGGVTATSDNNDPTLGIEYERRTPLWDNRIGVGVVGERLFDAEANIILAGVIVHPWKDLKVNLSAGKEYLKKKGKSINKNVTRVGVAYDFHSNNISYGPVWNVDRVDGTTAHVIGVAVGFGF